MNGRFLLCAGWAPWGPSRGYQQRLAMVAEAGQALGTVDVCLLNVWRSPELEDDWPAWVGDAEWCEVTDMPAWPAKAMAGVTSPVRRVRLTPDARDAAVARFFSRRYDVTWCAEPRAYEPIADLVSSPVVLDLHNVLSASVGHKRRLLQRRPWLLASWRGAIDDPEYLPFIEKRWRTWETGAAQRADRVVVCSGLDAERVGGRAAVIPNCYPSPDPPAGRGRPASGPLRIGFVGLLDYQPNFDAVRWFAGDVLPRVRSVEPGASFEVIGSGGPAVRRLGRLDGVHLHGFVDDLDAALAELSVIVVPIRFGGGTRFKVLEAFAHEIPVVSTTIGSEGIPARDGEHLLLRDEADGFARAILDVHHDADLRRRLVTAAAALHDERFSWERGVAAVRRQVAELVPAGAAE